MIQATLRRARVAPLTLSLATMLTLAAPATPRAAVLASFDFDTPGGAFDPLPDTLDGGVLAAVFSDFAGTLTDFAGNPGRALAASGFDGGNAIALDLVARPGLRIAVDHLGFDLRVSPSGPDAWQLRLDGVVLALGSAGTAFTRVDAALIGATPAFAPRLTLHGSGASSSSGTLRLDNVVIAGRVLGAVPLPATPWLLALPAVLLLGACRRAQTAR